MLGWRQRFARRCSRNRYCLPVKGIDTWCREHLRNCMRPTVIRAGCHGYARIYLVGMDAFTRQSSSLKGLLNKYADIPKHRYTELRDLAKGEDVRCEKSRCWSELC